MNDKVTCQICGKQYKCITTGHLKSHRITFAEYRKRFPNHSLQSEATRSKTSKSVKKIWENPKNRLALSLKMKEVQNRPEVKERNRQTHLGKKHTQEWNDNIRKALNQPEVRERNRQARLGKKHNQEWNDNIREAYNRPEVKLKMSQSAKCERSTPEAKQRMRNAALEAMNRPEVKDKLRKKAIEQWERPGFRESRSGKNNPCWRGGSPVIYDNSWTETLRRQIRERDNYTCAICKLYGNNIHHIDYDKENSIPSNLITLCKSCHAATSPSNRNYWMSILSLLLKHKQQSLQVA